MPRLMFASISVLSILILSATILGATPEDALGGYVDALKAGDWSAARSFWDESYLQSTERLGIQYADVPYKYDCASPVFQNLDGLLSSDIETETVIIRNDSNFAIVRLGLISRSDTLSVRYCAKRAESGWQLTSPYARFINRAAIRETRYCRVYYSDPEAINSYALLQMDRFIESTCEKLGVPQERIQALAHNKIDYYLVDETAIEELTGYQTKGMYDIPSDAVISVRLPHWHELTHLLVNYALETPALYTLPFLQEGLACHFGGRWGRSPGVIKYAGYINLQFGLAAPEDILSFDDFHGKIGTPEISYPISSSFVGYLIHRIGMAEFLYLYREFSGTDSYVRSLTKEQVEREISIQAGLSWPEVSSAFDSYWHRFVRFAVFPFDSPLPVDTALVRIENTIPAKIWSVADTYLFEVDLSNAPMGGLLLFTSADADTGDYRSPLFGEHVPTGVYHGEHYGIKFTPSEVGVYDYYCNDLLASLIYGCDPKIDLISNSGSIYRFAVSKVMFGTEDIAELHMSVKAL